LENSPLERGAFSIVEMEEAGCVEMRIPGIGEKIFDFTLVKCYNVETVVLFDRKAYLKVIKDE
jgi:hypothetical protein